MRSDHSTHIVNIQCRSSLCEMSGCRGADARNSTGKSAGERRHAVGYHGCLCGGLADVFAFLLGATKQECERVRTTGAGGGCTRVLVGRLISAVVASRSHISRPWRDRVMMIDGHDQWCWCAHRFPDGSVGSACSEWIARLKGDK